MFTLKFKDGVKQTEELEQARKSAEALLNDKFDKASKDAKVFEIVKRVAAGELTDDEAKAQITELMA